MREFRIFRDALKSVGPATIQLYNLHVHGASGADVIRPGALKNGIAGRDEMPRCRARIDAMPVCGTL